ncbi:MAG: NAD(P)-binding domain-containing protein, partial [Actinomycetota bacterium]|nr:NAD(P)-binding domain-containing protein [Actinomycetota bacterium]
VDTFGFRDRISFRTEVVRVVAAERGGYHVTTRATESREECTAHHAAVLVANGHHWDPRWPEPPFPGADGFAGEQMHSHHYKTPDVLVDRRVLVVGIGNSATDIAVESSRHAAATFLAMRRGAWILPKYMFGRPTDETNTPGLTRLPLPVQRWVMAASLRVSQGRMRDFGLPDPDHKLLEAHPTLSSDLLLRVGHGDVVVKPNIARFAGDRRVRFVDGSEEEIDLVVYCTGYKISFPFFDPGLISAPDNEIPLYRRVVSPEHAGLYFIGLLQPLGPIMPLAEAQSEWVADLIEGKTSLPAKAEMERVVAHERERMAKRYVASKRHTIQVDFEPYLRAVARERRNGGILHRRRRHVHELKLDTA